MRHSVLGLPLEFRREIEPRATPDRLTVCAMDRTAQQVEDELLVLRCLAGEPGAAADLVRRWRLPLLSHAGALLGREDPEVSDVVQETWVAVLRGLARLEDPARFRSWLFRIVTNKCADCIARRRRDRRLMDDNQSTSARTTAPARESGSVDDERVRLAIAGLDLERQAMLRMFYIEEMSIQEIGEALAIPAGTVKSRLHHTRNRLREILERETKEKSHEPVH